MKLLVIKTSDDEYIKHKNFNKVEELIEFIKENKAPLVIGDFYNPKTDEYEWGIEIYDDYRE